MQLHQTEQLSIKFTPQKIEQFASACGDYNPIHFNDLEAQKHGFQRAIVHGLLVASPISTILGTKMPGPGTIYLSQELVFKAPVFVNDEVIYTVKVISIREDKPIAKLETIATVNRNTENIQVITGIAIVKAP